MKEDYPFDENLYEEENNTLHVDKPKYEEVDEKHGIMQAHEPQEDLNSSITFNKSISLLNWSKDSSNVMIMNDEGGSKGKRGNNWPTEGTLEPLQIISEIDFKYENSNKDEKLETTKESKGEEPIKQLKLEEKNTLKEYPNKYLGKQPKDSSDYEERGYEESYENKEESDPTYEDSVENYHRGGNASALGRDGFGNMSKRWRYPNLSARESGTTPSSKGRNSNRCVGNNPKEDAYVFLPLSSSSPSHKSVITTTSKMIASGIIIIVQTITMKSLVATLLAIHKKKYES
eukprot:Gb_13056 [translate_table: standard]